VAVFICTQNYSRS